MRYEAFVQLPQTFEQNSKCRLKKSFKKKKKTQLDGLKVDPVLYVERLSPVSVELEKEIRHELKIHLVAR